MVSCLLQLRNYLRVTQLSNEQVPVATVVGLLISRRNSNQEVGVAAVASPESSYHTLLPLSMLLTATNYTSCTV